MNDRELLELAAKAAGIVGEWVEYYGSGDYYYRGNTEGVFYSAEGGVGLVWNPLTDDGDALRLAVQLEMCLDLAQEGNSTFDHLGLRAKAVCHDKQDPYAATRRAIVRAAAEIGKAMQ